MKTLYELYDMWQIKVLLGSIVMLISPIKSSLLVLFILICINILITSFYMLKTRRYNKNRMLKDVSKISTYFITIFVIRLIETGLDGLFSTTLITKAAISYLIITEGLNILDDLTLLGVPLPSGFLKIMLSKLPVKFLDSFLLNNDIQNYINEINDIIAYQIPVISSKNMQKLLIIKLNEWIQIIRNIDVLFADTDKINNNDLIFHRIENIVSVQRALITDKWIDANIPDECINSFNAWHEERVKDWDSYMKKVCYNNEDIKEKKKQLVEKILTLLYQTILDVQKGEVSLQKCK